MSHVESFQSVVVSGKRERLVKRLGSSGVMEAMFFGLCEAGYELSSILALEGGRRYGVQFVYKKAPISGSDYYRGSLLCVSFRENSGVINMSIHHSSFPIKISFSMEGNLGSDLLGVIGSSITTAIDTPGVYEWFNADPRENYRYQ